MKKRSLLVLLIGGLLVCLAACMPMLPYHPIHGPQTYRAALDFRTGDFNRNYHVYLPSSYDGRTSMPLVVVIHGAFDTAKGIEQGSGFNQLAEREGFVVMYPNGIGILGLLQHWNAGHCCGKAAKDRIDDVGYLNACLNAAVERLAIDPDRIYMVGFSNGGMLTHRYSAESGDRLAGAAVLAGAIGSRLGKSPRMWTMPDTAMPVAMLIMHGVEDVIVPFKGGPANRGDPPRYYDTVDDAVAYWLNQNGCQAQAPETTSINRWVSQQRWDHCRSGQPVQMYTLRNWAHDWPGRSEIARLGPNHPMHGFEAAEEIWTFFKKASTSGRN